MEPTNQLPQAGKRKSPDMDVDEEDDDGQLSPHKKLNDMTGEEKRAYNRKMSARARKRQRETIEGLTNLVNDYIHRNGRLVQLSKTFATLSSALADENQRLRQYFMEHMQSNQARALPALPQATTDVNAIRSALLAEISALCNRNEPPTWQSSQSVPQPVQALPSISSPVATSPNALPQVDGEISPHLAAVLNYLSNDGRQNNRAMQVPPLQQTQVRASLPVAESGYAWSPNSAPNQPEFLQQTRELHAPFRATSIPGFMLAEVLANRLASATKAECQPLVQPVVAPAIAGQRAAYYPGNNSPTQDTGNK